MHRAISLIGLATVAGCSRFPEDGGRPTYPQLTFTLQTWGEIEDTSTEYGDRDATTQYLYYVAIRVLTTDGDPEEGQAPLPVIGSNSPNGYVAGSPTHVVEYRSDLVTPFRLLRFLPRNATSHDQSNPIDLEVAPVDTQAEGKAPIVNFRRPSASEPNRMSFALTLDQLATPEIPVESIRRLQVNLLTMNVKANAGGRRAWDALGNSRVEATDFLNVDVRANRIYENTQGLEPIDDVSGGDEPSLDLQSYTIEVRQP